MSDLSGYFDLQVNGYAGVDFNREDLTVKELRLACERLQADGVAGILATIISDETSRITARLKRIAALCEQDPLIGKLIRGIHLEGPFLNESPGYRGAHPREYLQPADLELTKRFLDAGGGLVRLVTLAPERDSGLKVTSYLAQRGILVAAGHCDSSLDQLRAAIDAGLSLFTHLGNGCPMLLHRHDNIIQRALSLRELLIFTFIADGVHIPAMALGNYLRLVGIQRAIAVTDAISAAGAGPGRYTLGPLTIEIDATLVACAADRSHLLGSTATMPQMEALLRNELGLSSDEVRSLLCDNPRRLLEGSQPR